MAGVDGGVGVAACTGSSASAHITLSAASGCIFRESNEHNITLVHFSFFTTTVLVFVRFVSWNFSFYFVFVFLITVILVLVFWKRRPIILVLILIFVTKITLFHTRINDCPELIPVSRQSARRWHIHEPSGRLPLLSARPAVTFPAREHHRPLAGTKLSCLVTEAHGCEQFAQSHYLAAEWQVIKFATSWSLVQRPKHYTAKPPLTLANVETAEQLHCQF